MKESRAKFSFLPSGLSPSAPEYGSLEPSPAQPPDSPRRVAGSPKKILGLTAGAGISPAPESYLKQNYHTVITLTRNALESAAFLLGGSASGVEDLAHLSSWVAPVDGRARHEYLGAGLDHQWRRELGDAAVDLYWQVGHLLYAPDLLDHLGNERLPAETRVDAHDEDVVEVGQRPLDELRRGGRVQRGAGLAAAAPDHLEGPVQVCDGLGLHGNARHPGIYKGPYEVVGVVHHEVGVHGKVHGLDERGGDHGADGQVRDKVVVHRVEVDELRPAGLCPAHLLGEVCEVCCQDRRSTHHPVAEYLPERQERCLP